jgi:hypothetical protein
MADEPESALDAMNAALGEAGVPMETTDTSETEHAELPEAEAPEGEAEAEETSAEQPETDGETDAEAEARGAERDPVTGKFVKKGEEPTKPAEGEKPAEKKAEPKVKDAINDPIPKDLKKETSERIRTLIDTAKTVTAERDRVQQDFNYLVEGVQKTGTTPDQYRETLSWLALFNSNDPSQQEKALELVETVAERLATLLGKDRSVGDPLAAHADLKAAVASKQLTPEYAKEIARTRNGQQFRTELSTNAQQQQQQQEQAQNEEHQGRLALSELEKTLQASDPDYERKKAILVPALKPVMASVPWSQKSAKFLEAYKNLRLPSTSTTTAAAPPKNQPMRAGKQPAGGQTKAPGSMLEAVNAALGGMK